MQEDVYQGDGLNLYAYCGNNPVVYDDPSGYKRKLVLRRGKLVKVLMRVVVILLEDKHLERQRKRQVFQSQQNIKLTNLYLMELQKIELCMNLMYVERRNTL